MTDPLFTPLKSHPSTWEQEVAQLHDENTELEMLVMASIGQAAEAHEARLVVEDQAEALRAALADAVRHLEQHEPFPQPCFQRSRAALQESEG